MYMMWYEKLYLIIQENIKILKINFWLWFEIIITSKNEN
jgi:hypothetical protein